MKEKNTKKAIIIGIIAGLLVLFDGIITNLLSIKGSLTWVAFVSWTVFFGANTNERFKAVIGYIIGFIAAILIMKLGDLLSIININILGVALASIIATSIINYLTIRLELFENKFPISISGIFVGIAMTFSGLGIGLTTNNLENSLLLLSLILIYGILGLLSGWATIKFSPKK